MLGSDNTKTRHRVELSSARSRVDISFSRDRNLFFVPTNKADALRLPINEKKNVLLKPNIPTSYSIMHDVKRQSK